MKLSGFSFPYCLYALEQGLGDVGRLLQIVPRAPATEPRRSAEAAYRAAVILTCAAWEAYLEDLALDALLRVANRYRNGQALSSVAHEVAARTSRQIELAKIQWKDPRGVDLHRNVLLGPFNTPKAANTDNLFKRVLDLDGLSRSWRWRGVSATDSAKQLDALVSLRGDIAHRKKGLHRVVQKAVVGHVMLVERLGVLSCNRVRRWLVDAVGAAPLGWDEVPMSAVA